MNLAFQEPTVCWGDGSDANGGANRTHTLNHELFFFFFNLYVCMTSLEKESQGFPFCVFSSCFLTAAILASRGHQCDEIKLMRREMILSLS